MVTKSRRKNVSVTVVLAAAIGSLMAIMLIIVQVLQFEANEKNTTELLVDKAESIVTDIELGVRRQLDLSEHLLQKVALEMVSDKDTLMSDARLEDLYSGALLSHGRIDTLTFFDKNSRPFGMALNDRGQPELSSITNKIDFVKSDPNIQRTLDLCRDSDGIMWGKPEFYDTDSFLVIAQPIWQNKQYLGCLGATIEVKSLSELMARLGKRFDAELFIFRGDHHVLAHASLREFHPKQSKSTPLVHMNDLNDSVLNQIWGAKIIHGEFDVLADQDIQIRINEDEEKPHLYLTKTLYDYGEEPLTVGAWFPWESFSTQIMRLFWAMISGIILLILGVLLAVWMGRRIAKPIKEGALAAAKVSQFSLDDVQPLPSSHFKELNDQATAFNSMLTGLKAFGQYVPAKLVDRLIRENQGMSCISQERELTVIFTDIAGFTRQSENLPASEVARFLNHHFELLGAEVDAQGGTIDKYIGDAVMAFWGAPEHLDDAPIRACRAVLAINKALTKDNHLRSQQGLEPVYIRIGVHTGPVVVGNIGSEGRVNYTIVGDTVNATQRLESTARHHIQPETAATILISDETFQQLNGRFETTALGEIQVKGRDKAMVVHRLISEY